MAGVYSCIYQKLPFWAYIHIFCPVSVISRNLIADDQIRTVDLRC